jgi:hypothetical protein
VTCLLQCEHHCAALLKGECSLCVAQTLFPPKQKGAAVSSVLYLRNVLPESVFCDGEVSKVKLRMLDPHAEGIGIGNVAMIPL